MSVYDTKWVPFKNLDVDESEDNIKASAGRIGMICAKNLTATTPLYLKLYNDVAAVVSVGTTVPVMTVYLPPIDETPSIVILNFGEGIYSANGWSIAATTGFADNDTGAPGANEVIVNGTYR